MDQAGVVQTKEEQNVAFAQEFQAWCDRGRELMQKSERLGLLARFDLTQENGVWVAKHQVSSIISKRG